MMTEGEWMEWLDQRRLDTDYLDWHEINWEMPQEAAGYNLGSGQSTWVVLFGSQYARFVFDLLDFKDYEWYRKSVACHAYQACENKRNRMRYEHEVSRLPERFKSRDQAALTYLAYQLIFEKDGDSKFKERYK